MRNTLRASLLSTGMIAILSNGANAAPLAFEFTQGGYGDNGVFSGVFVGEDLNSDGQINSFNGEVVFLEGTYTQGEFQTTFSTVEFSGFPEIDSNETAGGSILIYDLNAGGKIGDDISENGPFESEFLFVSNEDYSIATGSSFQGGCNGDNLCGEFRAGDGGAIVPPGDGIIVSQVFDVPEGSEVFFTQMNEEPDGSEVTYEMLQITSNPFGELLETITNPILTEMRDDKGGFVFDLDPEFIPPGVTFFIDPEVAVGYTYTITGAEFGSVTAPSFDQVPEPDGMFKLTYNGKEVDLAAGEFFIFGETVTSFMITEISAGLGLDPTDDMAFVTGVSYINSDGGEFQIVQSPRKEIVDPTPAVPLPAGGLLLLSGLAGIGFMRRRKTA